MNKHYFMELNKYEVGKVYSKPDGTRWTFLGYYLEMPVWKVEGKYQAEDDVDKVHLPDRLKGSSRWKKNFLDHFRTRTRRFYRSLKA